MESSSDVHSQHGVMESSSDMQAEDGAVVHSSDVQIQTLCSPEGAAKPSEPTCNFTGCLQSRQIVKLQCGVTHRFCSRAHTEANFNITIADIPNSEAQDMWVLLHGNQEWTSAYLDGFLFWGAPEQILLFDDTPEAQRNSLLRTYADI
jgi:hypothetical protein